MFDLPASSHAHLSLRRQVPSGPRVTRPARFDRPARYPDQPAHARSLRKDLTQLRAIYAKRKNVLGVNPENVAVLTYTTPPNPERLRGAGLTVLEWFPDRVVVTAPGDPDMTGLVARLDQYQTGPRPAETPEGASEAAESSEESSPEPKAGRAPHQELFDSIDGIRHLSAEEILTEAAAAAIADAGLTDVLTFDLQCWCPEDETEARQRNERTVSAIEGAGGRVLDRTVRHRSGLSLMRVDVTAALARAVAELPDVRRIDRLPRPLISQIEAMTGGADLLPTVQSPDPQAPLIAVIDSGVRSGHPLIAPAFADAVAVGGLEAERDGSGHGTFVASLALYGSLEPLLERRSESITPAGRLLSVRILDDDNRFPEDDLWENDLIGALELAAAEGARIINVSVGDPRHPYVPARPTALAATVDEFIRRSGTVVVVSTGNTHTGFYDVSYGAPDFTAALLESNDSGLLEPATSALALTVGALGGDDGQGAREVTPSVEKQPLGAPGVPSPLTRKGPGAGHMVKPEAALPAGHFVYTDSDRFPRTSPTTSVVGAHGTDPNKMLALDAGTSYAAPLLAHIAARAMSANPDVSGRAVRALVLASIQPPQPYLDPPSAANSERQRQLTGYGRPEAERAAHSSDHRAVLIAEETLRVNNVHLYAVPIPPSFFEPGGWRRVTVSLAFDPDTRSTRLDYLGSRMQVQVYKGVSVDDVADAYLAERQKPAPLEGPVESGDAADDAQVDVPVSLQKAKLDLQPAAKFRSRGAHLYGTAERVHRFKPDDGPSFVVAVQNLNRWRTPEASEDYALCVVLEREQGRTPIYADLRAALQLELSAEAEIQIEAEIEL